jgi:plastocyanin domain-containing protein
MFNKNILWASLAALGLSLGTASATIPTHSSGETNDFNPRSQPLALKVGVTIGGVALIGLELWWFLLSKSPSQPNRKED